MIVIDASAILEILSESEQGEKLGSAIGDRPLHAPHLIDLEVANAIRGWEHGGVIPRDSGVKRLQVFRAMNVIRHDHTSLLDEIWALRHNLTAYDAAYLALSRALDAELVTMDAGLRKIANRR